MNNHVQKVIDGITSRSPLTLNRRSKEEDFEKIQKLGEGSFGVVYLVKCKTDNQRYVLKVVDTKKMSSN